MSTTKNKIDSILLKLETAKDVKGWFLDEQGNKENDIEVFDWDHTANDEEGIPDIVVQGNRATIFYDELCNATQCGNTINIANRYVLEII